MNVSAPIADKLGLYPAPFGSIPVGATFLYLRHPTSQSIAANVRLMPIYCKKVDKSRARPLRRYTKAESPGWRGDEGEIRYKGMAEKVFPVHASRLVLPFCEQPTEIDIMLLWTA